MGYFKKQGKTNSIIQLLFKWFYMGYFKKQGFALLVFIIRSKTFKIAFRYFAGNHFPLTHFFVESQGSKEKFTHSHKNFFFHQNKDLTQATFTQLLNLPILPTAEKLFTSFLIFSFSTSLRFTSLWLIKSKCVQRRVRSSDISELR